MVFQGLDQASGRADSGARSSTAIAARAPEILDRRPDADRGPAGAQRLGLCVLPDAFAGPMLQDDRPGSSPQNVFWAGDRDQAAQFIHAYKSAWLPAALLQDDKQPRWPRRCSPAAATGRFRCTRTRVSPAHRRRRSRRRATAPRIRPCWTHSRWRSSAPKARRHIPGCRARAEPAAGARTGGGGRQGDGRAAKVAPERRLLRLRERLLRARLAARVLGRQLCKLAEVKKKYDPDGLFFVHHGVGSDQWSADGFIRVRLLFAAPPASSRRGARSPAPAPCDLQRPPHGTVEPQHRRVVGERATAIDLRAVELCARKQRGDVFRLEPDRA